MSAVKKVSLYYGVNDIDWMNYKITEGNPLTYHHIEEKRNGGKKNLQNGAPLTIEAHMYLNILENKTPKLYHRINTIFTEIHEQDSPITLEQRKMIQDILIYYESHLKNENKNKKLVLNRYRVEI